MITFERTQDYDLVRRILTHPRLYPHLSDDTSPAPEDFRPQEHPAIWYVAARDGDELLGLWMLVPQNGVCWEVHTALLPRAWGERGQLAGFLLPGWVWANTPCRRIVTNVPDTNRLALRFALKAGLAVYGINPKSFLKHGALRDQTCLGISAPGNVGEGVSSLPMPDATLDASAYAETGATRKINACGVLPREV